MCWFHASLTVVGDKLGYVSNFRSPCKEKAERCFWLVGGAEAGEENVATQKNQKKKTRKMSELFSVETRSRTCG